TLPTIHNYNAIFSLGAVTAIQNSTNYATLAAYATGTSTNANSKAFDPLYISMTGPEISQYQLNGTGLTIAGITTDINGATRTSPPDIGADEFTPVMHDVKVSHVASPLDDCGLGSNEEVDLVLVNFGSSVATGFDVMMTFDGQTTTENIGSLQVPPGDSLVYTFNQTIDVSAFETYDLSFEIDYNNDVNPGNDSIGHSFTNHPPISQQPGNLIPVNGTTGLENQVSLSWSPVTDAVKYNLYVWPLSGSKPVTPTHAALTTINKLVTGLTYGTTYRWQVHALNLCDEELASDTSVFSVRHLPDLIVESMIIPATAYSEQTIGIEWVIKNQGVGATFPGTWYENIYLSVDPTYNSFDPLLSSVSSLNTLNPDQSYTHSANVVIPQGSNGLYYIIIKTDHYNGVKETADNNNTTYSATQINITLSPPPDLLVTEINTPAITFSGQAINVTYEVRNTGDGITTDDIWKDQIWLVPAANNNNGTSTVLGTRTHVGHLQPDSIYLASLQVAIPANIFGDYQIRVHTDFTNDVFEFASEGNNQTLSDVFEIVLTPPVDLVPDSLITSDTISLYQTNSISYQIHNNGGSSPTEGWTDRYYLSQSPVYNTNFLIHLGYVYHSAGLMPGDFNQKSVNIKLTGNYAGVYYLYVVSDYNNKINEFAFEGNNILRSDPFTIIRPDIKPDSLLHSANAMSGQIISTRAEIINPGPGYFNGNLINRYYLSADPVLSTMTDILLQARTLSNVTIGIQDTISSTVALTLPNDVFGVKYLLCHSDASEAIYESNENNNTLASPITLFEAPHSDLTGSSCQVPDTVIAGVPFSIAYTLTNIGDVIMTQTVKDSLFISFSSTWNRATATPLGIQVTSLLDTNQSITYTLPIQTAISQNPNQYYLYVISDATQKIYEGSGEANNILRSDPFVLLAYPQVDLKLTEITSVPDTLTSGQMLNIPYTITNLSNSPTYFNSWTEHIYFSEDSIFQEANDMQVGTLAYTGGSIAATGTKSAVVLLQIPHGITGDYYLFIETDAMDINNDLFRGNNVNTPRVGSTAKRIHVKLALYPDLQPSEYTSPVEVVSGQYFDIITKVTNEGSGNAGSRTDRLIVSVNNVIEQGDLTLASINHTSLGPGMDQLDTISVFVPANYSGNYFILYSVDHGNNVYEYTNEGNNILISSIIATPPPPADLVVGNILVPDSILAGGTANISWQTSNVGTNPASGHMREIIYLSTDTIWNVTDEVIGIWDGTVSLSTGSTITRNVPTTYNNITNADYHTFIRTDARNNIPESNESNNDGYSYDLTNVDIEEIYLGVVKETQLPAAVNLYYKLEVPSTKAGLNILVSLTSDTLAGINQLYIKYGAVPTEADHDLAYSTPFSPNQKLVIPDAEPGYYYILVKGFTPGTNLPQSISLLARIIRMEILDIAPRQGGNKGYTTIVAIGSELDSIVTVKLVLDDTLNYHEIVADTFFMSGDGTRVVARFNLDGQPLGVYHFQCLRESIWMASYRSGFEIIEGGGADLQVNWDFNPKAYNPRFNTIFQIKIDIENRGDADAIDRMVRVNTPNYDNPVYYSLSDYYNGIGHAQLILPSEDADGFPGVLRPGGRRTYYVFGRIVGTQGFSIFYDK
ncbi:MAG: hypothetical protein KBA14_04580, partial [Saprospiraceae bacterium]|nr:hypothetical protein [Saprospiraceae bacterium]